MLTACVLLCVGFFLIGLCVALEHFRSLWRALSQCAWWQEITGERSGTQIE